MRCTAKCYTAGNRRGNRAKLHLQVAQRLEELFEQRPYEVATELAHHFEKGGDARRARRYLQLKENLMSA